VVGGNEVQGFAESVDGSLSVPPNDARSTVAKGSAISCDGRTDNAMIEVGFDDQTSGVYLNDAGDVLNIQLDPLFELPLAVAQLGPTSTGETDLIFSGIAAGVPQISADRFNREQFGDTGPASAPVQNVRAADLAAHPQGELFVASLVPAALQTFSLNLASPGDHHLQAVGAPLPGIAGQTQHSTAFVNGNFLVVAEGAPNFNVDVIAIDTSTGALRLKDSAPVPGSFAITVHPNGRLVYALTSSGITALTVDSDGWLTVGPSAQLPEGAVPTAAAVDVVGTNLFVGSSNKLLFSMPIDNKTGAIGTPHSTMNLDVSPLCVFAK
jgi:hypothetical protein